MADYLDWVVVGCESGPARRPCPWAWVKNIVQECRDAGVPCYVKQMDGDHSVIYPGNDREWPDWAVQEQP